MGKSRAHPVEVRVAKPADTAAVLDAHRVAFGGDVEAGLVETLMADAAAFVPALSLVAESDGRIVGHVVFTRAHVGGVPAVLLAPLAVIPEAQSSGVGSALVEEGLRRARAEGAALALVLGAPGYYTRFGFAAAGRHGIEPPYPVEPAEAWMAAELEPGALWAARGVATLAAAFMDPALWRE